MPYSCSSAIRRNNYRVWHANANNFKYYIEYHKNIKNKLAKDPYYASLNGKKFENDGTKKANQGLRAGNAHWCCVSGYMSLLKYGPKKSKELFIQYLTKKKFPPVPSVVLSRMILYFPETDSPDLKNFKARQFSAIHIAYVADLIKSSEDKLLVKRGKFIPNGDEIDDIKWSIVENIIFPDQLLYGSMNNNGNIR